MPGRGFDSSWGARSGHGADGGRRRFREGAPHAGLVHRQPSATTAMARPAASRRLLVRCIV